MNLASMFDRPQAYYGPNGPGSTVPCGDCSFPADVLFGDHGGQCLTAAAVVTPMSALGVIRSYARAHPGAEFSINEIRQQLRDRGIKHSATHFTAAVNDGLIEHVGYRPSTDKATKGHDVKVYRSLVETASIVAARRAAS